jgi:hypothetical protein
MKEGLELELHNRQQAWAIIKSQLYPFLAAALQANTRWVLTVKKRKRTLDQNAKFHALCDDIARSGAQWAGKPRNAAQWKVLLVSGHAMATKEGVDMVPGIEGEFVNLRESTAAMSKARGSSLIEYTIAFCAMNGVKISEPSKLLEQQ